jgi:hypothetical protein
VILVAGTLVVSAADSRTYSSSIELVWDDAVKATRDADLVVTTSDRSEHWFQMETPKKSLKRTVRFEVMLSQTGDQTRVTVRAPEEEGSRKSVKLIAKYLAALDERLN